MIHRHFYVGPITFLMFDPENDNYCDTDCEVVPVICFEQKYYIHKTKLSL